VLDYERSILWHSCDGKFQVRDIKIRQDKTRQKEKKRKENQRERLALIIGSIFP
jgi:hypothetical protein